jgi:hypothetical protein
MMAAIAVAGASTSGTRSHAILATDVVAREKDKDDGGICGGTRASGSDNLSRQQVLHIEPNPCKLLSSDFMSMR